MFRSWSMFHIITSAENKCWSVIVSDWRGKTLLAAFKDICSAIGNHCITKTTREASNMLCARSVVKLMVYCYSLLTLPALRLCFQLSSNRHRHKVCLSVLNPFLNRSFAQMNQEYNWLVNNNLQPKLMTRPSRRPSPAPVAKLKCSNLSIMCIAVEYLKNKIVTKTAIHDDGGIDILDLVSEKWHYASIARILSKCVSSTYLDCGVAPTIAPMFDLFGKKGFFTISDSRVFGLRTILRVSWWEGSLQTHGGIHAPYWSCRRYKDLCKLHGFRDHSHDGQMLMLKAGTAPNSRKYCLE